MWCTFHKIVGVGMFAATLTASAAREPDASGLAAYREGDYKTAIPQLEASATKTPSDAIIRAALLSALVYEGRVDEASDAAAADAKEFPNVPEIIAARGEFAFYMGDIVEAYKLFHAAVTIKEPTPRAIFGLYRIFHAESMYRTARLLCLRAHQVDPDDALITHAWLNYLVPEKRKELLDAFIAAHPWFYKHVDENRQTEADVTRELKSRKMFELDGERKETTLHLVTLLSGANRIRGVGLVMRINGGRPMRLLLDTGASGILAKQSAVDKAELNHLGAGEGWGLGDQGSRKMFAAIADSCDIGSLKFKACLIRATEGKQRIAGEEDGLIGPDIFSDYLIQIDFQRLSLHLTPLPERPRDPQGYDRSIDPDEKGFTAIFRFGHSLMVPTTLNSRSVGLFLIDTGSGMSIVDSTFARVSTKIHGAEWMQVRGVSGRVKDVFEADKAVIQFAGYRQQNFGLISFNLNNSPEHEEVRTDGVLGFPLLIMFHLTLDYRNGLVKFDYIGR